MRKLRRAELRAAAVVVAGVTLVIVGGAFLVRMLTEAARAGGWWILGWAIACSVGALAAEYLIIRSGMRRDRNE